MQLLNLSTSTLTRSQYYSPSILDISVFEKADELVVLMRSMRDMFSESTIGALQKKYHCLLERAVGKPDDGVGPVATGEGPSDDEPDDGR